jgi:lysozyme
MQMSAQGVATLEHHEGVVLKAYRDVVGVWTIGAGLTAASGVVKPKAGMRLTREEATILLQKALRRNYEPTVAAEMPAARQHEFDAGVSFHFNTGAIRKATWVKRWRAKAAPSVIRAGLLAWNKGGGRVLPGLTRRRDDEARMLLEGVYPIAMSKPAAAAKGISGTARWALDMSITERARVAAELHRLGYPSKGELISADAVRAFQQQHGLTADGIIGRATLSTLQRRIDAAAKAKPAAAAPLRLCLRSLQAENAARSQEELP